MNNPLHCATLLGLAVTATAIAANDGFETAIAPVANPI